MRYLRTCVRLLSAPVRLDGYDVRSRDLDKDHISIQQPSRLAVLKHHHRCRKSRVEYISFDTQDLLMQSLRWTIGPRSELSTGIKKCMQGHLVRPDVVETVDMSKAGIMSSVGPALAISF